MSRDTRPLRDGFASESELGKPRGGAGIEGDDADSIRLGCSMLSQVRLQGRHRGALALMRCSLGFALRTREDIGKCMAVEGPSSCWKTAPSWRVASVDPDHEKLGSATELSGAAEGQLSAFLAGTPPNGAAVVELDVEVEIDIEIYVELDEDEQEFSDLAGQPAPNGSI